MKLNRSTSHAIRILIECARNDGKLVKVADLSAQLGITPQNVFKIVHILSHAGLVRAMRGRYGGVKLARAAGAIRVGDAVRAMESTEIELESEGTSKLDRKVSIEVNRVLDDALDAFISILDQHSLADLASGAVGASAAPHAQAKTHRQPTRPATPRVASRRAE